MKLDAVSTGVSPAAPAPRGVTNELGADDFLQLLVTQLANQDPLAPTSNEELLNQLSSIRDIQLSSTLADSLKTLTGNQRYGAAAALIGKNVTARTGDDTGASGEASGRVIGIRFDADGRAALELDSGAVVPLEQLESVTDPEASASALLGQFVRGRDPNDANRSIEGIVTGVSRDEAGAVTLELDTGDAVRLQDLIAAA